jgi:iron complex outermembrane recepter protein
MSGHRVAALASLTALFFLGFLAVAQAQTQEEPPPAPTGQPAAPASGPVEKVVVTGSRIPRPNLEQPTPVTTVTNERIQDSGTPDLGDTLAQFPALSSNGTTRANSDQGANVGGLSFPDLRSLGTARTLTLVNGKRHVGGDAGDTAVDLSSIPPALVDRIEVVTGGTSAIYGSDAVTGVINIILKDNFEGFEGQIQGSWPTDGSYGETFSANGSYGINFAQDRGNIALSLFYDKINPVTAGDIKSLNEWGSVLNPDDIDPGTGVPIPNNGVPDRLFAPRVVSEFIDENSVLIPFDHFLAGGTNNVLYGFQPNGAFLVQPNHVLENSLLFGTNPTCTTCFEVEDYILLVPDTERKGAAVNFKYDFTDFLRVRADAKYVRSEVYDYVQPSFSFAENFIDFTTNPFVDPALAAQIEADTGVPGAFLSRFNGDIGPRDEKITRETFRYVVGLEGSVDLKDVSLLEWEASYNNGETRNKFVDGNILIPGNFTAALDAAVDPNDGQIKCIKDLPLADQPPGYVDPSATDEPCVPFNPFGQQASQAAIDYVSHDGAVREHTITQEVFQVIFKFDTERFMNLQGGAIAFAGGLEHRKETSENINDPFIQSGLTEIAPQPNASGGFNVDEAFIETSIPILADLDFAHKLTVDAAYRYASYSHAGVARAWKFGGIYAPVKDLTFRGTYAQATRAPNITEAFLPTTPAFFDYDDPCDDANINDDPDRAANCTTLGMPPGFDAQDNITTQGSASGNPNLTSEVAETWTGGIVIQPRWIKNLSLTIDYYKIEIENAILFINPQDILNNCVDGSGGLDAAFCALVTRDPADFNVTFIESTFLNASALTTKGVDFQIAWSTDVSDWTEDTWLSDMNGSLSLSVIANYIEELRVFPFQSDPTNENIEEREVGDPQWSFITNAIYNQGPVRFVWRTRYEDEVARFAQGTGSPEDFFPSTVEAVWTHDFVLAYRLEEWTGTNAEVYVGVNNAFGEELPLALQGNGTSSAYDLLGRVVFVGARAKL